MIMKGSAKVNSQTNFWIIADEGLNGGSSKFYFNGGILKPTVSDGAIALALAGMAAPAQTLFMQYLTQVVVEQNGAIIDTAGQSISIAQSLSPGTGTGLPGCRSSRQPTSRCRTVGARPRPVPRWRLATRTPRASRCAFIGSKPQTHKCQ